MDRHQRLRRGLDGLGCAGAMLVGATHVVHLAGYSRYLSGDAAVVIGDDGSRTLVVPRYEVSAAEEHANVDRVVGYGQLDFLELDLRPALVRSCRELVDPKERIAVAGITTDAVPGSVSADALLDEIRLAKDADEVARIAHAVESSLRAQAHVAAAAADARSEIELFSLAQALAQNDAGEPIECIGGVLSGVRTAGVAAPVAVPGRAAPRAGDPVLADIALRVRGYWGDTTRTSIVGENAEAAVVIAEIARIGAQTGASLRPGVRACDVFHQMRNEILSLFPNGVFAHHGGHGIGIDVAEHPQLLPDETATIQEGMVLAIEPAVYFPGRFGVRVEDVYAVGNTQGSRLGAGAIAADGGGRSTNRSA